MPSILSDDILPRKIQFLLNFWTRDLRVDIEPITPIHAIAAQAASRNKLNQLCRQLVALTLIQKTIYENLSALKCVAAMIVISTDCHQTQIRIKTHFISGTSLKNWKDSWPDPKDSNDQIVRGTRSKDLFLKSP